MNVITKEKIKEDLLKIGLKTGDIVIVHSSLKSIGHVENGPNTVIDAFLEVLEKKGTLVMPTFTDSFPTRPGYEPFHFKKTASTVGLITDIFWKRSGVLRSTHPSHSVAACGYYAEEFIKDHTEKSSAIGIDSPLHKAAKKGALVLFLGTSFASCSLGHVAEVIAQAPYIDIPVYGAEDCEIIDDQGNKKIIHYTKEIPGDGSGFRKLKPILEEKGLLKKEFIGNAESMLIKGMDIINVAVEMIKKEPFSLLCNKENCEPCKKRKSLTKI
ncbi:MAG: AAC(3) family N-acetyltransferase [bacterium]